MPSKENSSLDKQAFWTAVARCLVFFHHWDKRTAELACDELKARLEKGPAGPDLIYHEEPFYVACNLARQNLRLEGSLVEPYDKILLSLSGGSQP